jgi:HK97 gp10 family phage protein
VPTITMTVRGGEQLRRNLDRLAGAERRRAQQDGLEAGIRVLETEVKVLLQTPGSGELYTHGSVTHQASAPGQPPAIDTGNLINSIRVEDVTPTEATLGVGAEYGEYLEFGTSRMAARPFLRPAMDENENEIVAAVRDTVAAFVESVRA